MMKASTKSKSSANSSNPKPGRQFRRLTKALAELKEIQRGQRAPARTWEVLPDGKGGFVRRQTMPEEGAALRSSAKLAVEARKMLGLSQSDFALLMGISPGTLRGWEQGRRNPNRAARVLLAVAAREPATVLEAAKAAE